jgi:hypothetical protein
LGAGQEDSGLRQHKSRIEVRGLEPKPRSPAEVETEEVGARQHWLRTVDT